MYRLDYGWYDNKEQVIVSDITFSTLQEAEFLRNRMAALDVEFSFLEVEKIEPVQEPCDLLWTVEETEKPGLFSVEFSGVSVTFNYDSIVSMSPDGYLFAIVVADSKEDGLAVGIKAIEDKGCNWVKDNGYTWDGRRWSI